MGQPELKTAFAVFALVVQAGLAAHFAAYRWRPAWHRRWGWLAYALSLPGLALGLLCGLAQLPWVYWLAPGLLAAWAALGYTVDLWRPTNWRVPLRWSIFVPYLTLYLTAQFAFWIPLWSIGLGYWISYTLLYVLNTALNIPTHFGPRGMRREAPS